MITQDAANKHILHYIHLIYALSLDEVEFYREILLLVNWGQDQCYKTVSHELPGISAST